MTKLDRYEVLKALFVMLDLYNKDTSKNTTYSEDYKSERINSNGEVIYRVVNNLLDNRGDD